MPPEPNAALGPKAGVVGTPGTAAVAPTGCCTISAPGVADRVIPGITREECKAIANAQLDAADHWVEGDCA
jgi:hypothetical protein